MNSELEPLLSAYLDGELDAPGRRRVEQATRSDPAVADRLAALARVRDLVATLSPPTLAIDVSGAVQLSLIRRQAPLRAHRKPTRVLIAVLAPVLAAAAVVLLLISPGHPVEKAQGRRVAPSVVALVPPPAPPRPAFSSRPIPRVAQSSVAIRPAVLAEETKAKHDREILTSMLGRGDVRLIEVTLDSFGPSSLKSMDEVILSSNFKEAHYARVRMVQEIVIDPKKRNPGFAYTLVMDEKEHRLFRANLDRKFPGSVTDATPPPAETLALLPTVGRVEIFEGEARATLLDPPAGTEDNIAARRPRQTIDDQVIVGENPPGNRAGHPVPAPSRGLLSKPPALVIGNAGDSQPIGPTRPAPVEARESHSSVYVVLLTARGPLRN
jgi:hypothetical protein